MDWTIWFTDKSEKLINLCLLSLVCVYIYILCIKLHVSLHETKERHLPRRRAGNQNESSKSSRVIAPAHNRHLKTMNTTIYFERSLFTVQFKDHFFCLFHENSFLRFISYIFNYETTNTSNGSWHQFDWGRFFYMLAFNLLSPRRRPSSDRENSAFIQQHQKEMRTAFSWASVLEYPQKPTVSAKNRIFNLR